MAETSKVGGESYDSGHSSTIINETVYLTDDLHLYRVYKRRWFVLATLTLAQTSSAMVWLSVMPVANYAAAYYNVSLDAINWLSMVFGIATVVLSLLTVYMIDYVGIRVSLLTGVWCTGIGQLIRVLSQFEGNMDMKFPVAMFGQTIAACGQGFVLLMPAKLSAVWFHDGERTLATTISSMGQAAGMLLANIVSPAIVQHKDHIPLMDEVFLGPAVLAVVMATFGVCSSSPPTPPSSSAAEKPEPFSNGIKKLMISKEYLILFFGSGGGAAIFIALFTLMTEVLCPMGYSDTFSGLCSVFIIAFGVFGAIIAGIFIDRTKLYTEVLKIGFCISVLCLCTFSVLCLHRDMEIPLAVCCALLGFFGYPSYPIVQELAVELAYPVAEASSAGLLMVSGNLIGTLVIIIMQSIGQPLHPRDLPYERCSDNPHAGKIEPLDQTVPMLSLSAFGTFTAIVIVLFLHPKLQRLKKEHESDREELSREELSSNSNS